MTHQVLQGQWSLLNRSEEQVLGALLRLPTGYQVSSGERLQVPSSATGSVSRTYLSDFVISKDGRQQVVVEVKSPQSLTMVNLSRLRAIDKHLREAGKKFVLLVPTSQADTAALDEMQEFAELRVYPVSNDAEIISAVMSEFDAESPASLDS